MVKEISHIWETRIQRNGYYDPEGYYHGLSKSGMKTEDIVAIAEKNGDYLGEVVVHGNMAVDSGLQQIGDLIIGASSTTWATAYIGAGNGSTAEAAGQTALVGASKAYAAMVSTYPKRSVKQLQFKSSFAAGVATFSWLETGVYTGNGTGFLLNRKVGSWGDKGASDAYDMEIDINLQNGT